jgi:hypothetical protein
MSQYEGYAELDVLHASLEGETDEMRPEENRQRGEAQAFTFKQPQW